MADGRSEMSNASGNSRRPTIDSNMSRERSYISRDINLLVAPTGGINNILPYLLTEHFSIDNFIAFGKKLKPIVDLTLTTSAVSLGSVEIGLDFLLLLLTELGRSILIYRRS